MIHTLGYEIMSLKQLSTSTCFKAVVRLMHSTRIKQALGVNRYKRMGTGCCIIGQQTNVDWIRVVLVSLVSNETNTDVCMYT